jgi:transcriptional accessory protein Tex/SPT6
MNQVLSKEYIVSLIKEELSRTDKSEIRKMIDTAIEKEVKKDLKKHLEDELAKALKSTQIKGDIGEIAKKVIKKLYKDLSFHHPYIIDRIKV